MAAGHSCQDTREQAMSRICHAGIGTKYQKRLYRLISQMVPWGHVGASDVRIFTPALVSIC